MNQLVTTDWLAEHLYDDNLVIADSRWIHLNPAAAYASFLEGHIPGAVYVSVDDDLSELGDSSRGRHPLPSPEQLVARLARKGIGKGKRVISTEEDSFKVAARLWWLLRWIGVDDVAVLDGGLAKWKAEGREVESAEVKRPPAQPFDIRIRKELMIEGEEFEQWVANGGLVFDARAPERYRGEVEGLDKRAGHIPGAGNIPLASLVTGTPARLKSAAELRDLFATNKISETQTVAAYCGSGVTACQLLWALDQAGYSQLKLYPGSWSEWIELHPDAGVRLT